MLERRRFEAGDVILREGDYGETAYIIEKGRVEITQRVNGRDVRLATLGPGETCGEMSLVDDKPRSATARALEKTEVREIDHDGFYETLQTDPALSIGFLKALFERLRESNARYLQLQQADAAPAGPSPAPDVRPAVVRLEGLTDTAHEALPRHPFTIEKFPFRIGRHSHNPLVHNDLMIRDAVPWQVSRHHVALIQRGERIGVEDRGSRLGSEVDGRRLGGAKGDAGPLFFEGSQGTLVLGDKRSEFRFKVVVEAS